MSFFRDLRDLVNVSRLTYRDSDDEDDINEEVGRSHHYVIKNNHSSKSKQSSIGSSSSQTSGTPTTPPTPGSSSSHHQHASMPPSPLRPLVVHSKPATVSFDRKKLHHQNSFTSFTSSSTSASMMMMQLDPMTRNSVELLLNRDARPNMTSSSSIDLTSAATRKQPLPPLQNQNQRSTANTNVSSSSPPFPLSGPKQQVLMEMKIIEPTTFEEEQEEQYEKEKEEEEDEKNESLNLVSQEQLQLQQQQQKGNYDHLLTYIDASVVSEWLNRSNRLLKKMSTWHKDGHTTTNIKRNHHKTNKKMIQIDQSLNYESFVLFANFWLGCNDAYPFSDKQRRALVEMEYSIICDEVHQAFQIGLDDARIHVRDVNQLLRAVFKEYPLQLLSFRGTYLVLDLIDILSSSRSEENGSSSSKNGDEYKNLLSDVKCRTVNKQFAQWLLSIRSFALITLCSSLIRFYRKTVVKAIALRRSEEEKQNDDKKKANNGGMMKELDGRFSALSMQQKEEKQPEDLFSSASSSSSTSINSISSDGSSSSSSEEDEEDRRRKTTKSGRKRTGTARPKTSLSKPTVQDLLVSLSSPLQLKHEKYLDSVFKHDLPEVLHYLITTKKCDPHLRDAHGRTLVFLAVMNDKPKLLAYLVKRWPSIDINYPCDSSGNTPLHAAVNKGKLSLVDILLQSLSHHHHQSDNSKSCSNIDIARDRDYSKLNVDQTNAKCMDATPLHLAVWNDYDELALSLMRARANPRLRMNVGEGKGSDAFELAKESGKDDLHELLIEYSRLNDQKKTT